MKNIVAFAYSLNSATNFSKAHGTSWVTRVLTNNKGITDEIFASVSNERSPILVTYFLFNKSWKNFCQSIQKNARNDKKKTQNKKSYCKVFCIIHKHNNSVIFFDTTKVKIVRKKITTFFKWRVSIILRSFSS